MPVYPGALRFADHPDPSRSRSTATRQVSLTSTALLQIREIKDYSLAHWLMVFADYW